MCVFLDFHTTQILTSTTVSIECISWLIKVTNAETCSSYVRDSTIRYDIYLLRLGFHMVAVVQTLHTKGKNSNIKQEEPM